LRCFQIPSSGFNSGARSRVVAPELQPRGRYSTLQELLNDLLAAMDGRAIPDDQKLARDPA
jgi:hypothetical protein